MLFFPGGEDVQVEEAIGENTAVAVVANLREKRGLDKCSSDKQHQQSQKHHQHEATNVGRRRRRRASKKRARRMFNGALDPVKHMMYWLQQAEVMAELCSPSAALFGAESNGKSAAPSSLP